MGHSESAGAPLGETCTRRKESWSSRGSEVEDFIVTPFSDTALDHFRAAFFSASFTKSLEPIPGRASFTKSLEPIPGQDTGKASMTTSPSSMKSTLSSWP